MEGVTNAKGSKRFPKEPGRMAKRCPGVERDENQTSSLGLCHGRRLLPGREPFRPRNGNEVRGEREVQKRRQRDSV